MKAYDLSKRSELNKFRNIDMHMISLEKDRELFDFYMSCLDAIQHKYDFIIPWCLFGRECINKHLGKYGGLFKYRHPVWNLSSFKKYRNVVDLTSLSNDIRSKQLWIDGNIHPSFKGYNFIFSLLKGRGPYDSFNNALSCENIMQSLINVSFKRLFIVNRSNYIANIYSLICNGALYSPVNIYMCASNQVEGLLVDGELILDFTEASDESLEQVSASINHLTRLGNYKIIFYSAFYNEYILKRDGINVSKRNSLPYSRLEQSFSNCVRLSTIPANHIDSCFELNRKKLFTQKFLFFLLLMVDGLSFERDAEFLWNELLYQCEEAF